MAQSPKKGQLEGLCMSKILVTGGAGFIGHNTSKRLLELGHEVVVVDNLSSGNNIIKGIKLYTLDILDKYLDDVFIEERPEYVFHFAANPSVRKSLSFPIDDAYNNIIGSLNLIQCSIKSGVKKFIYSSSGGACYGNPYTIPCTEHHITEPISPYGVSKHTAEHYLEVFSRISDMDYIILRYANVYGPTQLSSGEGGVISLFIDNIINNKKVYVFGDGTQTRDFVFIDDVVDANIMALNSSIKNCIFNVSSNKETTINRIIEIISNKLSIDTSVEYLPFIVGEVMNIRLSNSLIRSRLGWAPKTDLGYGIEKTIEWFKEDSHDKDR